jgi:hypothetical protein
MVWNDSWIRSCAYRGLLRWNRLCLFSGLARYTPSGPREYQGSDFPCQHFFSSASPHLFLHGCRHTTTLDDTDRLPVAQEKAACLRIKLLEAKKSPPVADPNVPAGYTIFLKIARSLQRQLPASSFMLPCHKLAPILECQPMTISRYLKKAIRDGHLIVVKTHSYRSVGKGEATEFQFLGQ